jgi:chaperonin cofactor prefoldin
MPTTPKALIAEAKRLERLQARRRKARRELAQLEAEIRLVRKNLRALAALDDDDQLSPRNAKQIKARQAGGGGL